MAQITAAMVKGLRENTGAGMMDCKKALTETDGDSEAAVDWLRKKGLAAAAKKASRVAAEGLVGLCKNGKSGAVVEINAETDFVARNESFQAAVVEVAKLALDCGGDVAKLAATDYPGTGRTIAEEINHLIATIGENIQLRRTSTVSVNSGTLASYMHGQTTPGLGRIGVLVGLESSAESDALEALGHEMAMHIAAARPQAISRDEIDPALVARERDILADQARASGKPDNIVDKMVEGRLRKYYEEVALLDQIWVIDGESRVSSVIEAAAKDIGAPIKIAGFARFQLGEGVEREESDFAADVAAQLGG